MELFLSGDDGGISASGFSVEPLELAAVTASVLTADCGCFSSLDSGCLSSFFSYKASSSANTVRRIMCLSTTQNVKTARS